MLSGDCNQRVFLGHCLMSQAATLLMYMANGVLSTCHHGGGGGGGGGLSTKIDLKAESF